MSINCQQSKPFDFSKPFKRLGPRTRVSVQHRLENARVHRPVRPDLDSLIQHNAHEKTDKELAEDFEKLDLADNDVDKNSTKAASSNGNELSDKRSKRNIIKSTSCEKARAADELFFRLSRGIRILPEGLPGQRGMVTPLCANNNELRLQIDKYCVIPPPWTTAQLKSLPECICFRNVVYSRCQNCGHVMKGRVYKKCERHPGVAFLLDFFFCSECLAETDELCEL